MLNYEDNKYPDGVKKKIIELNNGLYMYIVYCKRRKENVMCYV